ncbi:hypothetical protein PInf_026269 [Phytophthora infestans]|nr:hypothetical protein PInf_026269 [Phytophthora infestans]
MAVALKVYSPELLVTSTKPLLPCSTLSLNYLLLELVLATAELQITMVVACQFQNAVEAITVAAVQRGIENHQALLNWDAPLDELEVASAEGEYEPYEPEQVLPVSLAEVEAVKNMRFEPDPDMEAPADLYAAVKEIMITTPITMDELMVFLDIMFYMTLTDKGEYTNDIYLSTILRSPPNHM